PLALERAEHVVELKGSREERRDGLALGLSLWQAADRGRQQSERVKLPVVEELPPGGVPPADRLAGVLAVLELPARQAQPRSGRTEQLRALPVDTQVEVGDALVALAPAGTQDELGVHLVLGRPAREGVQHLGGMPGRAGHGAAAHRTPLA